MGKIKEQKSLQLREAIAADAEFLYELRNDDVVRKCSFNTELITYEQHMKWFERKQKDPNSHIFILEQSKENIGQVRVDVSGKKVEISYALCESVRGNGYAKWMLAELEKSIHQQFSDAELYAEVKRDNVASRKVFLALGYREEKTEYGFCYTKRL